jgi:hypothetical protein
VSDQKNDELFPEDGELSDAEIRDVILNLKQDGYNDDHAVWNESISVVEYCYSQNYCLMFSLESYRFHLHIRDDRNYPRVAPVRRTT